MLQAILTALYYVPAAFTVVVFTAIGVWAPISFLRIRAALRRLDELDAQEAPDSDYVPVMSFLEQETFT